MNRDRKLIFLTVLYFAILGCFLLGCSEGTDSSPVSALMGEITAEELQSSNSKITGVVLNSSTNEGIPNILVKISQEVGSETVEVKSDLTQLDGSFSFSGFNNGIYNINVKESTIYNTESITNDGIIEVKNGVAYPQKNFIYLKYNTNIATDTFNVFVEGNVRHSDGSSISNATASLYIGKNKNTPLNVKKVLSTDGYFFFNVEEPGDYYILIDDELAKNNTPDRIDFIVLKSKEVKPALPLNHTVLVKENENRVTLNIEITSAYTGAPLELATVKINNENQGTTDKDGKLTVANFPLGICNFEITKEGFETLTTTRPYEKNGTETLSLTMIEDTKDGYGSITGRYVSEKEGSEYGGEYVRLYRLIERTQTSSIGNKTETWYDVDKNYILTTKTSSNSGTTLGSFKLTHIEPGNYQIYITNDPNDIPNIEERSQVYNEFVWTQLVNNGNCKITQPLKVVGNQTTYWTNYEQDNNKKQGN